MKAFMQLAAGLVLFGLVAPAWAADEKVDPAKLPAKVAETVKGKFPGAKIEAAVKAMEKGAVIFEIELTKGGKTHELVCKEDGSIVEIKNELELKDLPAAVVMAVKAKYAGCTLKEAVEIVVVEDKKDVVEEYEVVIVTADKKEVELVVSPDGKKIE